MHNPSFAKFVTHTLQTKRIGFGDLRRLQRDVLPVGITARQEAEALISLDAAVERADAGWLPFLTTMIRDFVVGSPPGHMDPDSAGWLTGILLGAKERTAVAIAREVARDAGEVNDTLLALANRRSRPRAKPLPSLNESATCGEEMAR